MSMRWSYIGPLGPGGGLDWGQSAGANIPPSGTLPDIEDLSLYQAILKLVREGAYCGKYIDHDAAGLKVNGPELRHIIEDCYRSQPSMLTAPPIKHYLEYADNLLPNEFVALVAVAM